MVRCAVRVEDEVPNPWPTNGPISNFSPFDATEAIILAGMFCQELDNQNITIYQGPLPPSWGWDEPIAPRAECKRYSEDVYRKSLEGSGGGTQYSLHGRNMTISVAWASDSEACGKDLPPGQLYDTVSFRDLGAQNCQATFVNFTINPCKLSDLYVHDANLGRFTSVGGIYWNTCLRWTIVAIEDSLAPPDVLFGYSWG